MRHWRAAAHREHGRFVGLLDRALDGSSENGGGIGSWVDISDRPKTAVRILRDWCPVRPGSAAAINERGAVKGGAEL